jgi:Rod binding domain-containing protein
MIASPVDIVASMPAGRALPARRGGEPFSQVLHQAAQVQDRAVARDAATRLVSSVFIMPVLEALHDSPFVKPPFAPSFAEKQFQPLLDQQIADRIAGAANFPLVDVIVERLLGPDVPSTPAPSVTGGSP